MDYVLERAQQTIVQPGDIFFTKGTSFVSRNIRRFTRQVDEPLTQVNHTGVFIEAGPLPTAQAVEALSKVKVTQPWATRTKTGREKIVVFRRVDLHYETREDMAAVALSYVGRHYGYLKIVTHWLDWLTGGHYFFRRVTSSHDYPICSWVSSYVLDSVGIRPNGLNPAKASPDDLWDAILQEREKWFTAFPLLAIPRLTTENLAPPA